MKRFCLFISTVVLFVLCLVLMSSCATELDAPKNFKFDMAKQILSWDQSRGASGYTIVIGTEEVVTRSTSYSLENLEAGEYVIRIKANGDGENTKDSEFTEYPFTREYETGLRYKLINNNQEYQLVGIGTATGDVVMESVYRGKPVTEIAPSALAGNSRITSFVIGEHVKEIGKKAFYNSKAMVSVTIPEGVTTIAPSAFQTCTKLLSVTIPSTVTALPDYAFGYCRALQSVTIGANVKTIGLKAFTDCESLTSVVIPDSVVSLGSDAFSNCDVLASVTLSKNMLAVPANAFYRCKGLTEVKMGDQITSIGAYAFGDCEKLAAVTLPASLETIGDYAFTSCKELAEVNIGTNVREIGAYAFYNTKIYNDSADVVYVGDWIVGCKNVEITQEQLEEQLREETVGLGTAAFFQCKGIEEVMLPNVKYIGDYAFAECTGLLGYSFTCFSEELETIGDYAFYGCTLIDSFNFGTALKAIETYAFYGCVRLNEVSLPATLTKIGTRAFNDTGIYTAASGLVYADKWVVASKSGSGDIAIKDGTVGISDYCFYRQYIGNVTFPNSLHTIGRAAFFECVLIGVDQLPTGLKTIGDYAFYNCAYGMFGGEDLILELPTGLETIGRSAFYQAQLCGVVVPGTVKNIGDYAFWGCWLLGAPEIMDGDGNLVANGKVVLGEGIESIGSRAFFGCAGLDTIVIPNSVTTLGQRVFNKCLALKNVTVGSGLSKIGDYMFYNCVSIENITLTNGVIEIGNYAFRGCEKLKNIDFGTSVTTIGDFAFLGCTSLKSVVLPDSVTTIGRYAFRGLTSATSIYLSSNVESIGQHAFYGCNIATIYCEDTEPQRLWHERFNSSYRPIVFGVTFSADGTYVESFTVTETSIDNSSAIGGMTAPRRAGYSFAGWATVAGGEVVYSAADVALAPVGTTLYAIYTEGEIEPPAEETTETSNEGDQGGLAGGDQGGITGGVQIGG